MFYSQLPSWINLLLLGSCLVNRGEAIRCYVCNEDKEDILPCSEFQVWDARYSKECNGSNSCRISRRVNEKRTLSRSCERLKIDDCKTIDFTEFCYCTSSLCNKENPMVENDESREIEDDLPEDSVEGSGIKNEDEISTMRSSNIFEKNSSTTKTSVSVDKALESNVIPSDQKHSSSCIILRSNFHLSIGFVSLLYIIEQYY